ncbi:ATP-binding protein [Thermaurantiacus sp.]
MRGLSVPEGSRRGLARLVAAPAALRSVEVGLAGLVVVVGLLTYGILARAQAPAAGLSPTAVTTLLIVNLVPLLALLVLIARRIAILLANRRAGVAGASLHVRLVALFAALAAVPTILVVAFASLLFQFGVQFWFSDRARTILANADRVAQAYVADARTRIRDDILAMERDVSGYALDFGIGSGDFAEGLAFQVAARSLSEASVFRLVDGIPVSVAEVAVAGPPLAERLAGVDLLPVQRGAVAFLSSADDRVEAVIRLDTAAPLYVYVSRRVEPRVLEQVARTETALSEYQALIAKSRLLEWRFNLILLFVSLFTVAVAIWLAMWLATRLVAPLRQLAEAAEKVGAGDFGVRVPPTGGGEEVETLARAFNRMTTQIEAQQAALRAAGDEAEARRRFIEAILSGVSAGVIAIADGGTIRLANRSASVLLGRDPAELLGRPLAEAVPELAAFVEGARADGTTAGEVGRRQGDGTQTLAVRLTSDPGEGRGYILTFDDISQQIADQRRAAWSDVARRIAHEIKNPLTPIMLSAERLKRRFAGQVADDRPLFDELTSTIIRQTEDLRRMVDEFSAFARMPGPTFREENVVEVVRQALFLAEVAAPHVRFRLAADPAIPPFVCDRRQLGQAFTNLLKNAIEAIGSPESAQAPPPEVDVRIACEGERLRISIADTGCGLPAELRERLFEPYVTTRARGTGLGLAIVKRIIEDHCGRIELSNREDGRGAVARLEFDLAATRDLLHDRAAPPCAPSRAAA